MVLELDLIILLNKIYLNKSFIEKMKIKTNSINIKANLFLSFFLIAIIGGFGLLNVKKTQANTPKPQPNTCACLSAGIMGSNLLPSTYVKVTSEEGCKKKCNGGAGYYYINNGGNLIRHNNTKDAASTKVVSTEDNSSSCNWTFHPIDCIFLLLLRFMGLLLSLAATIFGWIMDPKNMLAILNNKAIYQTWALVRDTLNIAFILVLLFSAFATIFQIDKYSYKNILLKLVLMALLVNFSYPITRFIIDFSNVLMYQIFNNLGGGSGWFVNIANHGGLKNIIHPSGDPGLLYILSAVVFVFILAITFLVIAMLLVIRTIVLAMLIIFSPVAFTGSIIPALAGKVGSWWDNLFKYAFFGPIMIFMIYVAVSMLANISTSITQSNIQENAGNQTIQVGLVSAISIFSIPIIILWVGLGFAQSLSIAGAGAVTGQGKKFAKWSGKNLGGVRPAASWISKKSGVTGGVKQKWNQFKSSGPLGSVGQAQREAKIASKLRVLGAEEQNMKQRAAELKKNGIEGSELEKRAGNGDIAAAYRLAEDGKLDGDTLNKVMGKTKNIQIRNAILDKTSEKRMDITLQYKLDNNNNKATDDSTRKDDWNNLVDVARSEYGKLTAEKWAKQKDLAKQFKNEIVFTEATGAFKKLHRSAQIEALKRMNGSNASAIIT